MIVRLKLAALNLFTCIMYYSELLLYESDQSPLKVLKMANKHPLQPNLVQTTPPQRKSYKGEIKAHEKRHKNQRVELIERTKELISQKKRIQSFYQQQLPMDHLISRERVIKRQGLESRSLRERGIFTQTSTGSPSFFGRNSRNQRGELFGYKWGIQKNSRRQVQLPGEEQRKAAKFECYIREPNPAKSQGNRLVITRSNEGHPQVLTIKVNKLENSDSPYKTKRLGRKAMQIRNVNSREYKRERINESRRPNTISGYRQSKDPEQVIEPW